jgi:hypothetical protein
MQKKDFEDLRNITNQTIDDRENKYWTFLCLARNSQFLLKKRGIVCNCFGLNKTYESQNANYK